MKVQLLRDQLSEMITLIESLERNMDLETLIGQYKSMITLSGYFFSDDEPKDILKMLESFKGDIYNIREDIDGKVQDNGNELEV